MNPDQLAFILELSPFGDASGQSYYRHFREDIYMDRGPNTVRIDPSALTYNLQQVRKLVGKNVGIMGIVKSDAYGHGLIPVSQTFQKGGIDYLGVAYLHEAIELRKEGITVPIVILCGILTRDEARTVVRMGLIPVLFDLRAAEIMNQECEREGKKTAVHLKVDTGMGRLGFPSRDIGTVIEKFQTFRHLDLQAFTSHLSSADEDSNDFTEAQIASFQEAIKAARSMGLDLSANSLSNSAGVMSHKRAHFDVARPGIMLYGGAPSPQFPCPVSLKPAMHFTGRILQIRDLPDRTPVSYGRTYHTQGQRRTAVLSAGYGNGLPRSISNRGFVLIRGKAAPIVGTVCMNLTICDVTGLDEVTSGEAAVFLGSQGRARITGDDMARWAGTISYEIFCSIGQRNPREYGSGYEDGTQRDN
jgi:alanine racemase